MAFLDAADLLARVKALAARPSVDEITDAQWYSWLSEAQAYWLPQIAAWYPDAMYGPSVLMTTADAGLTYTFPSNVFPIGHYEVREKQDGRLMIPGPDWDQGADFVVDGSVIRFPGGRKKLFTSGPYARYIDGTNLQIDATGPNAPKIKPEFARLLLVPATCRIFATRGGMRDPRPYRDLEKKLWSGDPEDPSDAGILGVLKTQAFLSGSAAIGQMVGAGWWASIDDGSGYSREL